MKNDICINELIINIFSGFSIDLSYDLDNTMTPKGLCLIGTLF